MYIFNRITVNPQLPKRIGRITEIANNLWWSWNTEFLRLFKMIDIDLWERCNKNPVKFLKAVDQEKLEEASKDLQFVKDYDKVVDNFDDEIEEKLGTIKKDQGANKVLLGDGTYADISDAISDDAIQEAVDKALDEEFQSATDGEIDNLFA